MVQCPRCQHENPAAQKFCGECGARLAAVCGSCGTSNPSTQKFCGECGGALTGASSAKPPSPESYTPSHLAEKILTSKAALEGERKQVTVLFADLKGSMELLADRDPEEARRLLDPVLEFPYVMARPPHVLPSHLDVENDVGPIAEFIERTNAVIMGNHGVTTLGRSVSEAYHRLNTLTSEVRRNVLAEQLAALRGTEPHFLAADAVEWMYRHAESVIYPSRDATRRPEGGERRA